MGAAEVEAERETEAGRAGTEEEGVEEPEVEGVAAKVEREAEEPLSRSPRPGGGPARVGVEVIAEGGHEEREKSRKRGVREGRDREEGVGRSYRDEEGKSMGGGNRGRKEGRDRSLQRHDTSPHNGSCCWSVCWEGSPTLHSTPLLEGRN